MKATIKARWLAALRSGKYRQGRRHLQNSSEKDGPNSFCCLGVLCDLLRPNEWKEFGGEPGNQVIDDTEWPSDSIYRESGLDDLLSRYLALMNDKGSNFSEIADVIEERA